MTELNFSFTSACWLWQSQTTSWHFITLPKDKSEEIHYFDANLRFKKRGWGAVRVTATIGQTTWETSVFPHKALQAYILPIKADVRKKESVLNTQETTVSLIIDFKSSKT
jgi:hypothetical protein